MSNMFKKIGRKKKEDASKEDSWTLPIESEGFICPICMEGLRSAEALQVHWDAAHSGKETAPAKGSTKASRKLEMELFVAPLRQEGTDELEHCRLQIMIMTDLINEERRQNTKLCGELLLLEGVLEQSGDQRQEELRSLKQMFEQSEQSRITLMSEFLRLTNENSDLQQAKQTSNKDNEKISEKAASLAVTVATLQAKLDETSARADDLKSHVLKLQTDLKEQEIRNDRLSVKLQQRPEADDVRALQQQLSCLHILMEKNSSDHELELERVRSEVNVVEGEKERLEGECLQLKTSLGELPKVDVINKLDYQLAALEKESEGKQESIERAEVKLGELQSKFDAAPKRELLDKYISDVETLTSELKEVKDLLNEKVELSQVLQIELSAAPKQSFVERLQTELRDMKSQLHAKSEEIRNGDAQIRDLELKLAAAPKHEKLERLVTELKTTQEQLNLAPQQQLVDSLQASVVALESSLQQSKEQLQQKEVACLVLQEQQSQVQVEVRRCEEELSNSKAESETAQKEKHDKELLLATVRQQLKQAQSQLTQLEAKLEASVEQVVGLDVEVTESKEKITFLQQERTELISKMEAGEGAMTAISQLQQEKSAVQEKLESVMTTHHGKIREWEEKMNSLSSRNCQLQEEVESLRDQCQSKASELERREAACSSAQGKVEQLTSEVQSKESLLLYKEREHSASVAEVRERMETATRELEHCTREMAFLRESTEQLKSRAITEGSELKEQLNSVQEEAKKQLQEMATELHCKDSLLSDREREFSKLKCRLEGEVQELSQQLAHTKIEAENSEKFLRTQLDIQAQNTEEQVTSLQQQLVGFQSEKAESETKLTSQISNLEDQIQVITLAMEDQSKSNATTLQQLDIKLACEVKLHEELGSLTERLELQDSKLKVETLHSAKMALEITGLKVQMKQKDEQLVVMEKNSEHKLEMLQALKTDIERGQRDFDETCAQHEVKLKMKSDEIEDEMRKIQALERELDGARDDFKDLNAQLDQADIDVADTLKRATDAEEALSKMKEEFLRVKCRLSEEVVQLDHKLSEEEKKRKDLNIEMVARETELKRLHEHKDRSDRQHQVEITALSSNLAALRQQTENGKKKIELYEVKVKGLTEQLDDMKAKSRSQHDEHRTLLEKFLTLDDQNKSLLDHNTTAERNIQELQIGLQELGREHQTLQIVKSRQNERKWEKDKEAVACNFCHILFSVSVRRHHCRNCGHIFCQSCTSKSAQIPSSKKPVRVCNTCFTDLKSH